MNDELKRKMIMWLMFIGVSIVAGFLAYQFILKQQQNEFRLPTENPEVGLGMEGAICGGKKRLPCMPGNQCKINNAETNEGVCVHVTDDPGKAEPPRIN
jgi:hypothetical protein